ncbi:MAG: chromosome partitioning protein [Actinobacteria bacterium]|nr:chromosome partitioning protein [Actinomycetota bacterium]MBW3650771.1 chromosome partitioning protein [Actinomycetota bacterium]
MSFVALASAKGSPGVTTLAASLAATWPVGRELLLIEADPAGGALASRFDLRADPGLVSLAAAGRRDLDEEVLGQHLQQMPGNGSATVRLLPGPVAAEQASVALSALRGRLAEVLERVPGDVIVDCGRLDAGSPALELVNAGTLLALVLRPNVADVHHASTRLAALSPRCLVGVVVVGDRPYSADEVAAAVGAPLIGTVPADPRAAAALNGEVGMRRGIERTPLLRASRKLGEQLIDFLAMNDALKAAG